MGHQMTKGDIEKIEEEIRYRTLELRPKLLEAVKTARAQGDLSENFEYYAAKRENNRNNSRIRYLEKEIRNAIMIEDNSGEDEVGLYNTVTVYFPEDDEEETYKVVTSMRQDLLKNRISNVSPIGKALIGKKVGDTCHVVMENGASYDVIIRKIEKTTDDGSDELKKY